MNDSDIKLAINKQINVPVEKVYQAWTDPKIIKQWFGPGPVMKVPKVEIDLKVDGEYLIHLHNPEENSDHIVSGSYEQIIPNEKIVFNWKWRDGVDRTQVTVEFRAKNKNQTLVTLTHRGFSQQEFAAKHNQGWNDCLAGLDTCLS